MITSLQQRLVVALHIAEGSLFRDQLERYIAHPQRPTVRTLNQVDGALRNLLSRKEVEEVAHGEYALTLLSRTRHADKKARAGTMRLAALFAFFLLYAAALSLPFLLS